MNILHLLDEPWDSGITSYALQCCDLLIKAGQTVVMGVRSGKKPDILARDRNISTAPIDTLGQMWDLYTSHPWDVINVHNGRSHTWMVVFNLFSRRKIPIVRTRGDARPVPVHAMSRFVVRRTAAIVSASEHISQQYKAGFRLDDHHLQTVYPSIPKLDEEKPPLPMAVGMLGRLDPVKGHSVFLEAAALVNRQYPQVQFLIAGKEAGLSIALLRNQAEILGLGDVVQFLGFQASAIEFMRRCSIGVIASLGSEEISRACLEWLAVGRPVIGTLVGSIPELIEPDETGFLVPPRDSVALAQSIMTLLKDEGMRARFGRKAAQDAQLRFSPHQQMSSLMDVYRRVAIK